MKRAQGPLFLNNVKHCAYYYFKNNHNTFISNRLGCIKNIL